ncbi:MAG: TIGR03086 family metal-binding protein [Ilumatobacter sp.]|uniref:TIGR03086 family metal-binding protein n=1 Tax=Ilumatobacter sp. TaxID=1967498 RepID=UPI003C7199D2
MNVTDMTDTTGASTMHGNEQLAIIIPKLREVGARIDPSQLDGPSPCKEFTVAGVLGHMTGLASGFAPMFRGEEPPSGDLPPDDSTDLTRFDRAMADLLDAVQSPGALDRTIQTPGGEMPGAVFARLVAFDGLVHGWDLAISTGQPWDLDDDLVAEIDGFARQAITDDLRDGDAFATEQQPAADATPVERLVAFSGRMI